MNKSINIPTQPDQEPPGKGSHDYSRIFVNLALLALGVLLIEGYNPLGHLLKITKASNLSLDIYKPALRLTFKSGQDLPFETTAGPSRHGDGIIFNGSGSYLALKDPIILNGNNATISWWMKRDEHDYETIFSTNASGNSGSIEIDGKPAKDNTLEPNTIRYEISANNQYQTISNTGINTADDRWHHYALVMGADSLDLYINNKLVDSRAVNKKLADFIINFIGYQQSQGEYKYGDWFQGALADIQLYNRALSKNEIAGLYFGIPMFFFSKLFKYLLLGLALVAFNYFGRVRSYLTRQD